MIVDVSRKGVVVRPQRRQHSESFLQGVTPLGVVQHLLGERIRIKAFERQPKCDVAVGVYLQTDTTLIKLFDVKVHVYPNIPKN